jgi:Zn-dependent protease
LSGLDPLTTVVGYVVLIFSIIVHENAHGLAAEYFGDPTARALGRITMNPIPHVDIFGTIVVPLVAIYSAGMMFGWAKPVPVNSANLRNPVVHNAYVAAAGPFSNLCLALGGALLLIAVVVFYRLVPSLDASTSRSFVFFNTMCGALITWNTVLALFNLLPIPPLDGHWILMRFLPPGPRQALASIGRFGFLILIFLMMSGVLWKVLALPVTLTINGYYAFVNGVVSLLT